MEYEKPSLTADVIVFRKNYNTAEVLLIKRKTNPFKDFWAIPGGFSEKSETIEESAIRELQEETSIIIPLSKLSLLGVYSKLGRDPRGWIVSVAFVTFLDSTDLVVMPGDDAKEVRWFDINNLPALAFDHELIISNAIDKSF